MKCLLIETKDNRKFFTHEKNFVQLIEFSKAFNAQISLVKLQEGEILEFEELAPAICDAEYKKPEARYEIIEIKTPIEGIRSRAEILQIAEKVQKYIKEQFQNHKIVSLKELKNKFKKYGLNDSSFCNHIRRVKLNLEKEGLKFVKISAGQYKVK